MRLLYLHKRNFSDKQLNVARNVFNRSGFVKANIASMSLERLMGDGAITRSAKTFRWDEKIAPAAKKKLAETIKRLKPQAIVINDDTTLKLLTNQWSLDKERGSIYLINGIPALVVDDIFKLFSDKTYSFLLGNWLAKLKRWANGKRNREPKFSYTVCTERSHIGELCAVASDSIFVSLDLETSKVGITSVSFTCLGRDGYLRTIVLPFVNPLKKDGCHWEDEADEVYAWKAVKEICESNIYKVLQNGCYDAAWLLRYRIPLRRFLYDTLHLWRTIWPELEKNIAIISSVCCDTYRFWKDEIKGEAKRDKKTKQREGKTSIPKTEKGYNLYLRYNGLDTHYAALDAIWLVARHASPQFQWAAFNYCKDEWPIQIGPNFIMTMRGLLMNKDRQAVYNERWINESAKALSELREMVDDPEFNPNSPIQLKSLLFDVLGAQMPNIRGKGIKRDKVTGRIAPSTDEKILKFIRLQHPLLARVIDKVWAVKKPLNNASKYGEMKDYHGRFMYGLNILTECNRDSSANHPYWYGTNAQNIPVKLRPMFVADPGKFIFNSDYSQSDAYFVAFYSQDPQYIHNILCPEDTHCIHAEFFFREPYEKIYTRYKAKDPWAVDPIKGVRQNTKRITHGAGYQMQGGTLYVTMGHEAAQATALNLGFKDCYKWSVKQWGVFCQLLINRFQNELYPRLPKWFEESCKEAIQNQNKVVVYGGRTRHFFGDIAKDHSVRREISSYFGQGGTAANVNQALRRAYYGGLDVATGRNREAGWQLHLQVHDSIVTQSNRNNEGLRAQDEFLTIMETPVTILGRTFVVPTESEVGISWEGASVPYKRGIDVAELMPKILAAEEKLNGKFIGA